MVLGFFVVLLVRGFLCVCGFVEFFCFVVFFFPLSFTSSVPPFYQLTACLLIPMATQQAVAFLSPLAVVVPGMCLGSSQTTKGFCRE